MKPASDFLLQEGLLLHRGGDVEEAAARYSQVLAGDAHNVEALFLLGVACGQQGRPDRSADLLRKVVKLNPKHAGAHNFLGLALNALNQPEEALKSFNRALRHDPNLIDAYANRAKVLIVLGRGAEAVTDFERLLAISPDRADLWCDRGFALERAGRLAEALASYDRAIAIAPNLAEAHANRGNALALLGRHEDAVASYDAAIAVRTDFAEAWINRGNSLRALGRANEADASHERAVRIRPDIGVIGAVLTRKLQNCDWAEIDRLEEWARKLVAHGTVVEPSVLVTCSSDPAILFESARLFAQAELPAEQPRKWNPTRFAGPRIKVAYLSADYHRHATAYLIAELFELHDRNRFEIIGISWGPDDKSETRDRIVRAFDRFIDVSSQGNREVAELLRSLDVNIAVDLKGYTEDSRPGILAARPAPIQVSYLGYPATMGCDFIDYVIGDRFVTPFAHQPFYSERIVQLPESYQVNDRKRRITERTPARAEEGLPEDGFVFCCFNNTFKLRAPVFDVWMRLLDQVDSSVLWLLNANDAAKCNLAAEAEKRGVDPKRLVFANRVDLPDHLARLKLVDLFLDTLPYNAHTTASDALWAGVPVLTCAGASFAGRVGASLLHAAGLPELVTDSLDAYERRALALARDRDSLHALRQRLIENRSSCALFDTDAFRRHIETAFEAMWRRWRRGLPPESLRIDEPGVVSPPEDEKLPAT
ncbi:MAG TPA: tetratricopeptide repeat protein [Xanthobacteraceae bacterium]|nr:tetratricopeptide repeat protein [Xanthobacteraceae bacterium]